MVRKCCVPGCASRKKAPSHKFPRNVERRLKWYKALNMEPVEGSDELKLRVCYKHFRNSDYNCSLKLRVLLSNAVPVINMANERNITETELEILQETNMNMIRNAEIPQETNMDMIGNTEIPQETDVDMTRNIEMAQETDVDMTRNIEMPQETDVDMIGNTEEEDPIEVELHELKTQQQRTEKILTDHSDTLMLQQKQIKDILQNQENNKASAQEIAALKHTVDQLVQVTKQKHVRPDLQDCTRKNALSPRARQLYITTVKLKRDKRHLKRLCKKYKQESRSNTITMRTTDYKGRADNSAMIRQQFIDMIIRNNDLAPQVKSQVKLSKREQL